MACPPVNAMSCSLRNITTEKPWMVPKKCDFEQRRRIDATPSTGTGNTKERRKKVEQQTGIHAANGDERRLFPNRQRQPFKYRQPDTAPQHETPQQHNTQASFHFITFRRSVYRFLPPRCSSNISESILKTAASTSHGWPTPSQTYPTPSHLTCYKPIFP